MTKQHLLTLLLLAGLLFAGCQSDDMAVPAPETGSARTLKITALMPLEGDAGTRVTASQKEGSKNIELRWKERDVIQFYFKQENKIIKGDAILLLNFSADGKRAEFTVPVPGTVNTAYPFDLYGVHGAQSAILDNAIVLDGRPSGFQPLDKIAVPIFFKAQDLTDVTALDVVFRHYGALHVATLKNSSPFGLSPRNIFLSIAGNPWFHQGTGQTIPVYDLISETVLQKLIPFDALPSVPLSPLVTGDNTKLAQWVMPNGQNPPGFALAMTLNDGLTISSDTKPARTQPLMPGHTYHLYAVSDGTGFAFSDETATKSNFITFTTEKAVGGTIVLRIYADPVHRKGVWLDLNNDGKKDSGESVTNFVTPVNYTIGAQAITLYGNVLDFYCTGNNLTMLDVTKNTALQKLYCDNNQLAVLDVTRNISLTTLDCSRNWLTTLDITRNTALTFLSVGYNLFAELNLSSNTALTTIFCNYNRLAALDVTRNTALTSLYCQENQFTALDVSKNAALSILYCYKNLLTELDVSNNANLATLDCSDNQLATLDITTNTKLERLKCDRNKISTMEMEEVVNALPDRTGNSAGNFIPIRTENSPADENVCTQAQVATAKNKNWKVIDARTNLDYEGS